MVDYMIASTLKLLVVTITGCFKMVEKMNSIMNTLIEIFLMLM